MKLSLSAARALLLAAQGLSDPPTGPANKEKVLTTIRRMGLLQIDTISVVARSPYLVLWSRLGAYELRWLDELLAEGALFEYWAHAACFLPIEHYGLYRCRMLEIAAAHAARNNEIKMQADAEHKSKEQQDKEQQDKEQQDKEQQDKEQQDKEQQDKEQQDKEQQDKEREHLEATRQVLAHIRERGAARSVHFTREGRKAGTWWDWKPEKIALERLFNAGVLMIARREGFQRVYDLQERVLPDWDDQHTPTREAATRGFALQAVKALGVATAPWVVTYFNDFLRRPSGSVQMAVLLAELAQEGQLARVEVADWRAPAYVHPENLSLAEQAVAGTLQPTRTTFLSPFDPVVSDRARAKQLFGFDYRIETYTPAAKRVYGYFSLPILHHDTLIGRLDAKAHRRQGLFEVKAIHLESNVTLTEEIVAALGVTLQKCADWHKTPEVVVRHSNPTDLASLLAAR